MSSEIAHDASPFLVIYKDGRIERFLGNDLTPPSLDPTTGVHSKDVVVSPQTGVSARIYTPKIDSIPPSQKLPLLMYFHGGGFCVESAFSPLYHAHLNSLVAAAKVIAVSVDYRRAPEHPLPAAFEDSWAAVQWALAHCNANGSEDWLNRHADFSRIYLAGDSAGANIAHRVAIRAGTEGLGGVKLRGIVLVHPYFWGEKLIGEEEKLDPKERSLIENLFYLVCPTISGLDDPIVNPDRDPDLGKMAGERVAVYVAEMDSLKERGWLYGESLRRSGWGGAVEVVETKGEGHVFHLFNPKSDNAVKFVGKLAAFINAEDGSRE